MNPERKVREEKNEEQQLTCFDIFRESKRSRSLYNIRNMDFQRLYDLRQVYAHPPEGCSKDNVFQLLYRIASVQGLEVYEDRKYVRERSAFKVYSDCIQVSRYLRFLPPHSPQESQMSWEETSLYLDESKLTDPFEMAFRCDQLTYATRFENQRNAITTDPRFRFLQENRLPEDIEYEYLDNFVNNDRSYVFMRQLVEARCDWYMVRKRILERDRNVINRMWEQFRNNGQADRLQIQPLPGFWSREVELRYEAEENQRQAQRQSEEQINQSINQSFWQPVESSFMRDRRTTFNVGTSNSTFGSFQFFLVDDVRRVWGNDPPFVCDNAFDAITCDKIVEGPLPDNRLLIYFYPQQGIVECWDAYGLSANCAVVLDSGRRPKHPFTNEDLTKSSLALLGFVHGILREGDAGYGVKQKYTQEVFDKFKNQAISELQALEAKQAVEATFDNPTIVFKRMLCERKHWFDIRTNEDKTQDKIFPLGLCSAQPLKDFLDLDQYEAELLQKITVTKATIASKTSKVFPNPPPPPPRNPPTRRTNDGAGFSDSNEKVGPLRRVN